MNPKIYIKNIWSTVDGLPHNSYMRLYDELSYDVPGACFAIENAKKIQEQEDRFNYLANWDGKKHLLKKVRNKENSATFLSGLISRVYKILVEEFNVLPEIIDERTKPEKILNLEWNPEFILHNYQSDVVTTSLRKGRGLIEMSTGSGKTLVVSKIIQEVGVCPFIFYVLTKDLMYQAKERLEEYIKDLKVGVIGDGICDIKEINIMTIQTAYRCYEKPSKKEKEKFLDLDESDLKKIKSEKLDHLKKKESIIDLIESAKGIYIDECLVGNTKIINSDGIPIEICKIRNGENILGGCVSNFFSKNVDSVEKIIHSCGELTTSLRHKHLCIKHETLSNGQRKFRLKDAIEKDVEECIASKLEVNDFLLVPTSIIHNPKEDNKLTFNQMRLIGAIMGDGHIELYGYKVKINVSKDYEWFKEVFESGLKDFGIINYISKIDSMGNLLLSVSDKVFNNFLVNTIGINRGKKSNTIKINEYLWNNPIESLLGLVDGLFGSEGDVSKNRVNILNSSSYEMICDIQLILLKLNIISNIQTIPRKSKKHNNMYRLSITGDDIQKTKKINLSMERKYNQILSIKKTNIKKRIVTYKGNSFYLSKIKKIEKIEKMTEVFDFTCNDHVFIANNALTHNCHHTAASTCQTIVNHSNNAYYIFGGTATLEREDNADLEVEGVFGRKIGEISASFLIERGFLIQPNIFYINLKGSKRRVKNYSEDYKQHIVDNDERNKYIVEIARNMESKEIPTLILVQRIEHGEMLRNRIPNSVFLQGKSTNRQEAISDLKNKRLNVLIATSLADEGLDIQRLKCLILAGGGKSSAKCKQRVGRVIRTCKAENKKDAFVYDFNDIGRWVSEHSTVRRKILKQEPKFIVSNIDSFEIVKKKNIF